MITLKGTLKVLAVGSALLALTGCGQSQSASGMSVRATGARAVEGQSVADLSILLNGRITNTDAMQATFQAAVAGFMSEEMPPSYLGFVSDEASTGTGILFGGSVTLAEGSLSSYSGTGTVLATSALRIRITDSFPSSPNMAPLPDVYLPNAVGSLVGNSASIRFYDGYGYVELDGQFDASNFTGQVTYMNLYNYDGTTPGSSGTMGNFTIPTCAIFVCN
jgi:hypothetical protein